MGSQPQLGHFSSPDAPPGQTQPLQHLVCLEVIIQGELQLAQVLWLLLLFFTFPLCQSCLCVVIVLAVGAAPGESGTREKSGVMGSTGEGHRARQGAGGLYGPIGPLGHSIFSIWESQRNPLAAAYRWGDALQHHAPDPLVPRNPFPHPLLAPTMGRWSQLCPVQHHPPGDPQTLGTPNQQTLGSTSKDVTWLPDFMSFMFMAFFMPLPFSFLFFFFLQQHFLQMQKQQVRRRRPATTAMAMRAQGGTAGTTVQPHPAPPPHTLGGMWGRGPGRRGSHSQGILLSSFMNFSLRSANMSSLLSPVPAASVEFSMVAMGIVVAVASGAIMDACLNVMVGLENPATQHRSLCPRCSCDPEELPMLVPSSWAMEALPAQMGWR